LILYRQLIYIEVNMEKV